LISLRRSPFCDGWTARAPAAEILHYASDDGVFIDHEYVIKGVAGRVLWRILRQFCERHCMEFSHKEIRLDQTLALPASRIAAPSSTSLRPGTGSCLNADRPLTLQKRP
jgi:hypothetical protein